MISTTINKHRGFSLVEVLIALIILSVGMLGIAGLYVQSMQAGRTSLFRHHAVNLAGDVADRIRANPRAGGAYAGDGNDNSCIAQNTDCDEAEMADNDIFVWKAQASDALPTGDVSVIYDDSTVPPNYQITVTWDEPNNPNPPSYTITIPVLAI